MPANPTLVARDTRISSLNDPGLLDKLVFLEYQHAGFSTLLQAADQDVTNLQDQDSDALLFATAAGGSYLVDGMLILGGANTANDAEFRLAVAAGTMTGGGSAAAPNSTQAASAMTLLLATAAANTAQVSVGTFGAAASPTVATFQFAFTSSNATTFKVQFGNLVTGGGIVTRMLKGSFIRWKQTA